MGWKPKAYAELNGGIVELADFKRMGFTSENERSPVNKAGLIQFVLIKRQGVIEIGLKHGDTDLLNEETLEQLTADYKGTGIGRNTLLRVAISRTLENLRYMHGRGKAAADKRIDALRLRLA